MFTEHCSVWCTCVKIRGTHAPKMAARVASSRVTEPKIGFASTSTLHATQHQLEYSILYYIYIIYILYVYKIYIYTSTLHATTQLNLSPVQCQILVGAYYHVTESKMGFENAGASHSAVQYAVQFSEQDS